MVLSCISGIPAAIGLIFAEDSKKKRKRRTRKEILESGKNQTVMGS